MRSLRRAGSRRSRRGAGASPGRGLRQRKHGAHPRRPSCEAPHATSLHTTWPTSRLVVSGLIAARSSRVLSSAIESRMDDLRLLLQILDAEPGKRRRPVERLGDARHLAADLPCAKVRPCGRSAARRRRRCPAGGRAGSPLRARRRESRDSDRGSGGEARRRAPACAFEVSTTRGIVSAP